VKTLIFRRLIKIMGYQNFEELEVWKKTRELKNEISQ